MKVEIVEERFSVQVEGDGPAWLEKIKQEGAEARNALANAKAYSNQTVQYALTAYTAASDAETAAASASHDADRAEQAASTAENLEQNANLYTDQELEGHDANALAHGGKIHAHANKDVLDKVGEDVDGDPTWNGGEWPGADATPVGSIFLVPQAQLPDGYLPLDGLSYFKADYPDLASAYPTWVNAPSISENSGTPSFTENSIRGIAVDQQYLYIGADSILHIYERETFNFVKSITLSNTIRSADQDDSFVYVGTTSSSVHIIDKSTLTETASSPLFAAGWVMSISNDLDYIYVGHRDVPYFTIFDKATLSALSSTPSVHGRVFGVCNDADRVYLACTSAPHMLAFNKTDWSPVSGLPDPGRSSYAIDVDDDYIYMTHNVSPGWIVVNKHTLEAVAEAPDMNGGPYDAPKGVVSDGALVYVADHNPRGLAVVVKSDWSVITPAEDPGIGDSVAYFGDTAFLGTTSPFRSYSIHRSEIALPSKVSDVSGAVFSIKAEA